MTEIFIEPELENLEQSENAEAWYGLCVELGLQAQAKLADKSKELKAPPYMFIDPKTERIIKVLCPIGTPYKEYSASTIPLDVLQEIQKCEINGWYKEIKIFHDDKSPDPFVVGYYERENSKWLTNKHLIARWGAELIPFEQLEIKAIQRMKDSISPMIAEMRHTMEYAMNNTEMFIKQLLSGKDAPKLNVTIPDLDNRWELPF